MNAAASASQATLAGVRAEASEAATAHAHAYAAAQEAIEEANARALAAEQQLDALRLEGIETPEQVKKKESYNSFFFSCSSRRSMTDLC